MLVTDNKLPNERLVRNRAQTVRVERVRTLHTHQQHLIQRILSADPAIMPRAPEHAGMLLLVPHEALRRLLHARHVVEASAVVLRAFDQRLVDLVQAAVRVDHAARSEQRDELLDVVNAQPLLVEREAPLLALPDRVALLSAPVAEAAFALLGDARAALPLARDLLQPDAAEVELPAAAARARDQLVLPLRALLAVAAEAHALDGVRRLRRRGQKQVVYIESQRERNRASSRCGGGSGASPAARSSGTSAARASSRRPWACPTR